MSTQKTKDMTKRLFIRSVAFLIMTVAGLLFMNLMVEGARNYGFELPRQFPEVLMVMQALTMLTWIEVSLFWIRLALQPTTDVQVAANVACKDPMAAAVVYLTHGLQWLARLVVVLVMAQLV